MDRTQRKPRNQKLPAVLSIVAALAAAVTILLLFVLPNAKDRPLSDLPLTVRFVDVGQGDGAVIRCEDTIVLIDCGEEAAWPAVDKALKAEKAARVDCFVATHPHSDHVGAAGKLFAAYDVGMLLTTPFTELTRPTSPFYEAMIAAAAEEEGCETVEAMGGRTLEIGPLRMEILAPLAQCGDYNDMSLVIRMRYKAVSFLFTGDAGTDVEAQILDAGADVAAQVLKVGHHGSESSTGERFLQAVNPSYAVISCGFRNDYGHPDDAVLDLLKKYNVQLLRTDDLGDITLYSDGKRIVCGEE